MTTFNKNALPDNALREQDLSVNAITTYAATTSHPRLDMGYSLASQSLVLLNPDRKCIQNGFDTDVVDSVDSIAVPEDCKVRKLLAKNRNAKEYIIIYESIEVPGRLGYIQISTYNTMATKAGYELIPTEALNTMREGKVLSRDEILATSRSVKHGSYDNGIYANVAFIDSRVVPDDSMGVCKEWLDGAKYNIFRSFQIEVTENDHLRNLYGTDEYYKPIPDVGMPIREDNILIAKVETTKGNISNILDPDIPDDINPVTDKIYYDRAMLGGIIESVEIIHNNQNNRDTSTEETSQLKRLVTESKIYYENIEKAYFALKREIESMGGVCSTTNEFATMIEKAMVLSGKTGVKLTLKQAKLPKYLIKIVTRKTMMPLMGGKLSPITAGKGVICDIAPRSTMPMDKDGVYADIIIYHGSVVNRLTPSSYYEQYIMSVLRKMTKELRIYFLGSGDIPKYLLQCRNAIIEKKESDTEGFNNIIEYLAQGYKVTSHPVYDAFIHALTTDSDGVIDHIAEALYLNIAIMHTTDYLSHRPLLDIVCDTEKTSYAPTYDKIWVINKKGERVLTKNKIRIGPIYMLVINKRGDELSSTNTIRQNTYGVAGNSDSSDSDLSLFSMSNITSSGRMETPFLFSLIGPEASNEYHDMMSNPSSIAHITMNQLEDTIGKEMVVNRKVVPHGDSRPLKIIRHFLHGVGIKIVQLPEPKVRRKK